MSEVNSTVFELSSLAKSCLVSEKEYECTTSIVSLFKPSTIIISPTTNVPSTPYNVAWSEELKAFTRYPLAPDVCPTNSDPKSIVCAVANSMTVNICTSNRFILYVSSALPKVVSSPSDVCSIAATLAKPTRLPAWLPPDDVKSSLSSIVWYAFVNVDPVALGKP